jgi:FAD:protein FMN transferase
MDRVTLARNAMATRFELVLIGTSATRLRAAGEEALDEIERIEGQLSLYNPASEIAQVNRRAGVEPVRVSPPVFELLTACRALSEVTGGAFDITVAPLVRCWGFMRSNGSRPADSEIAQARQTVGMSGLELGEADRTVRFLKPEMMLDLGSIGKGYAIDAAADILRENGVAHALLHGGTSTIYALGIDPENGPWKIALEVPGQPSAGPRELGFIELQDAALSVSAVWGKHFVIEGQTFGHVIDPRTGWPARDAIMGAAIVPSATMSDALSTGVLLGSDEDLDRMRTKVPGLKYLQICAHCEKSHNFPLRQDLSAARS